MMPDKKDTNDEYKKKHELFVEKLEPFYNGPVNSDQY